MFDLENQGVYATSTATTKTIPREYAYNFATREIIMKNGSPKIVEGVYAIKIWIYKTLLTQRGYYMAYSFGYGEDYADLIGSPLSYEACKAEAQRMTIEALASNEDIIKITNFGFTRNNDKFDISFIAETTYGNIEMEVTV